MNYAVRETETHTDKSQSPIMPQRRIISKKQMPLTIIQGLPQPRKASLN